MRKKITVTRAGNTITVSDGKRVRHSCCANASAAKSLASRLERDQEFAGKWMRFGEPVQLELPLTDVS